MKQTSAKDWADSVSGVVGGKAGGKGATSQGIGTNPEKLEDGVEAARAYLEKLGI